MNNSEEVERIIDQVLLDEPTKRYNLTTPLIYNYPVYKCFNIAATLIGLICDLLIIHVVSKNPRMKSRRNVILLNWAIFDALDFPLLIEFIGYVVSLLIPHVTEEVEFRMCFINLSSFLFKFNCIVMMILLLSTTVMRMQFITDTKFQWALYIFSLAIYLGNFSVCYFVSDMLILFKFAFLFFVLVVIVVVKEINMCWKAHRDDPVSDKTKVKMNIVRIYTYNFVFVMICSFVVFSFLFDTAITVFSYIELTLDLTSLYMLVYLFFADENFQNALKNLYRVFCCRKYEERNGDATVIYSDGENREVVDFTRI